MEKYDTIADEQLILEFRKGNSEIMDYLMVKYKSMVRKKARAMYLIGGENEDLIQEGDVYKRQGQYQGNNGRGAWIYRARRGDFLSGGVCSGKDYELQQLRCDPQSKWMRGLQGLSQEVRKEGI